MELELRVKQEQEKELGLLNGVIKEKQREMKRKFTLKVREENLKGVNNWVEKQE